MEKVTFKKPAQNSIEDKNEEESLAIEDNKD
jgi:hypothetical protein